MHARATTCPSDDELTAFVEGRLGGGDAAAVDAHIDACEACRALLVGFAHAASTAGGPLGEPPEIGPGAALGRYVVGKKLGAGAMGVVFEALDPELDRKVAIKLVHASAVVATPRERARMLREAQAMARLSHPNLVPVLAVGLRDDAVYVVMELVAGATLRAWLAATRRPWRAIVGAYVAAGRALAAAHAAGVVHRDFKPDNVLVGQDGRVRVIDFGLARVVEGSPAEPSDDASVDANPQNTAAGVVLGTPAYMPPEQLLDAAVDARADQFALAVSLWEGLFGVRPFDDRSLTSRIEAIEAGRLRRPPAGPRVPARLQRALARALSPAPEQRFVDMDAFVREIERAAAGGGRRLGLTLAVAAAAVGSAWWMSRAGDSCVPEPAPQWTDDARERTADAFARARVDSGSAAMRALDERVAAWHDAYLRVCTAHDRDASARAAALACLDVRRLEIDASIDVIASGAADVVRQAPDIVARLPAAEPCASASNPSLALIDPAAIVEEGRELRSALARARALGEAGRLDEAIAAAERVLARAQEIGHDAVRAETECRIGALRIDDGDPIAAIPALESAYFDAREIGHDAVATEAALELADATGSRLGRIDEGTRWLEHAAAAIERRGSAEAEADLMRKRGSVALRAGDAEGAVSWLEQTVERWRGIAGGDDPRLADAIDGLGVAYFSARRLDDALARCLEALAMRERLFGPTNPRVAFSLNNVALVLMDLGQPEAAIDHYEWALAIELDTLGPEHYTVAAAYNNIGAAWGRLGEPAAAAAVFAEALPMSERLGPDHPDVIMMLTNLGFALLESGDELGASDALERALAGSERHNGADHPATLAAGAALAHAATRVGAHRRAAELLERALARDQVLPGYDDNATALLWFVLGDSRLALGRRDAAADALAAGRAKLAAAGSPHPEVQAAERSLAHALGALACATCESSPVPDP